MSNLYTKGQAAMDMTNRRRQRDLSFEHYFGTNSFALRARDFQDAEQFINAIHSFMYHNPLNSSSFMELAKELSYKLIYNPGRPTALPKSVSSHAATAGSSSSSAATRRGTVYCNRLCSDIEPIDGENQRRPPVP